MTFNIPGFRYAPGDEIIDDSEWDSKWNADASRRHPNQIHLQARRFDSDRMAPRRVRLDGQSSFPLDGSGGLAGDVVNHAVNAAHLIHNAA
jgi:hypothetical protein